MIPSIVRTPADIISQHLMLPYGDTGISISPVTPAPAGGTSNILVYMPTTGEGYPDRGLVNEYSARWLAGIDPPDSMFNWAEAGVGIPCNVRDASGNRIDLIANPKASVNPRQGPPVYDLPPQGPWTIDPAHWPETNYIAYLAFNDPRYLSAVQDAADVAILLDNYWSGAAGFAVVSIGQTRLEAWGLRNIAQAYFATQLAESQGPLPAGYHPSSYFKAILDNQLSWLTQSYMDDPALQTFRCFTYHTKPGWWQADYLNIVLAFMAMRLPEWRPIYLWTLGNMIARLNGTSGFPPALATWYYGPLGPNTDADQDLNVVPRSRPASDYFATWGQVFDNYAQIQIAGTATNPADFTQAMYDALKADQYNGGAFIGMNSNLDYNIFAWGALAAAIWLDRGNIVPISQTYPELEQCFSTIDGMMRKQGSIHGQWSVNPDSASTQPPNGVITMPSGSLIVGTTHTATFTANGPLYGTPSWSITPAGAATLTPAAPSAATPDIATCSLALLQAGPFTLTCVGQADPTSGANPITASVTGTVILQEATSATLTIV